MTGWELVFLSLGCLLVGFLIGNVWAIKQLIDERKP